MDTFNFFENQLVGVQDMMALQTMPQSAIRDLLASLMDSGVITGLTVFPTLPVTSYSVVVSPGKIALNDGSIVSQANSATLDLSSYSTGLTVGQSRWLSLYAVPTRLSDTPVVTPQGATIQYRTYDAVRFVVIAGDVTSGQAVKSTAVPNGGGTLIADVEVLYGQTITAPYILYDRTQYFTTIPTLLSLVKSGAPPWPISDIINLQSALDGKLNVNAAIPQNQVSGLSASLSSLQTQLTAQINKELSDVAAITTTNNTQQSSINTLNTTVAAVQSTQTTHTNQINTANATLASHTGSINNLNNEVASNTGSISSLNSSVTTLNGEASNLTGRVGTAEGNIVTLQAFENGFTHNNNGNGYWRKAPDGYIHQWGRVATDINGGTLFITFPVAFTNAASISIQVTTLSSTDRITFIVNGSIGTTGFTISNNGSSGFATWSADGY